MRFNRECPYCHKSQTIDADRDQSVKSHLMTLGNADGERALLSSFVVCTNPECRRFTLRVSLAEADKVPGGGWDIGEVLRTWKLIPPSQAKPLPDFIPGPIRKDYEEACLIVDLSPKASAALARRCLQGMIRDYWKITKYTLHQEIKALEEHVDKETFDAMMSLKGLGNIGAHPERDVTCLVDIEPEEASVLIALIEILLDDWYVAREKKKQTKTAIRALSERKDAEKSQPASGAAAREDAQDKG